MILNNLRRKHSYHLEGADRDIELEQKKSNGAIKWELSDSFHLRLLIHYVGDIHQPLHTSSRYTSQYPDGDQGGNLFRLSTQSQEITNLHALWDSVLNSQELDMALPLDETRW